MSAISSPARDCDKGNPILACAPGVKEALLAAADDRGADPMTADLAAPRPWRSARARRAAGRGGARLAASAASNCSGRAIRRSGIKSVRFSIPSSAGRATARGSAGSPTRWGCTVSRPKHEFQVEAAGADFARLVLRDDAATRAIYPFAFRARGRISAERPTRSKSRSRSKTPATNPRLTPADCTPAFIGPSQGALARARSSGSKRTSAPRFPSSRRAGLISETDAADPLARPRARAARRAVRRRRGLLPRSGEPLAAFRAIRRHSDRDGFSRLRPYRALDASGRAVSVLEAWTGYSDPEGFAGDLFEKPACAFCRRRAARATRRSFVLPAGMRDATQ